MRVVLGILTVVLAAAALWLLSRDLLPPKALSFAAGGSGGGYWAIAERYRDRLARDGIAVEIVETSGSVENVALLARGAVDVALVQGGIEPPATTESLGALFFEPMFFFARRDAAIPANPGLWSGLRIAAGGPGSGTAAAFDGFAAAAGLAPEANERLPFTGAEAARALQEGAADIAVFVAPIGAPYLAPLHADPGLHLLPLEHILALSRGMSRAEVITLPAAGISFAPVMPPADLPMLGMVAHLVARADLHPSLVDRLAVAAQAIHSPADVITRARQFPSADDGMLPFDTYAASLIREGPSELHDVLPYWVVAQINRFALLLLPIFLILVPVLQAIPGLYAWRMRRRVFRHYAAIREIDAQARAGGSAEELRALLQRLDRTDQAIAALSLPPPYSDRAYTAQLHIDLVRQRIETRLRGA